MPEAFLVLAGALGVAVSNGGGEIRLESVGPKQLVVVREALAGGFGPVRVRADQNADVLAIPVATLLDVMGSNRLIARDVNALAEARRLAIRPLSRGPRAAA